MTNTIFAERRDQVHRKGEEPFQMACDKESLAGAVSQRACVFCGSRVVLYPITDALHLVHGPIGCAAYTWDIRGALSSGPELHRHSYSTDLQERDVIFGGEEKLYRALVQLIDRINPKAAFVYSTCIVGIIGDDLSGVCKKVEREKGIPVIPVESEGFKGNKRAGYNAACRAMFRLVGTAPTNDIGPLSLNILGDFNLAGEIWIIREYFERMGLQVVANITGDGRVHDIRRSHGAALNVVQCSGSTIDLAQMMEDEYKIPFMRVSYFGVDDMADSLYKIADFFKDQAPEIMDKTKALVRDELSELYPKLKEYRKALEGKKAAIYVGGAFKAFSLVKAFKHLGMTVELVGSQTGTEEDYRELHEITDPGTIIVDDSNPLELSSFLEEKDVDIFVGGVKERPIAYKLGVGFCDHNHERKEALEGFVGMLNFAEEVYSTVMSPVWRFTPRKQALSSGHQEMEAYHERKAIKTEKEPYVATTNSCKLCAPLGACLAFKGIEGAVPFLHGSQGCATYMRRYVISHFREPVDIASSSLGEKHAIYGGGPNLKLGLKNVMSKYRCALIGVATTCLTETIGDDTPMLVREFQKEFSEDIRHCGAPDVVNVSTPSYSGSHIDGFQAAVRAIVDQLASTSEIAGHRLNLFPGFVSPADIRYLREIIHDFGVNPVILPDISETLDAPAAAEYRKIPTGGTPVAAIKSMGAALFSIEFGRCLADSMSASTILSDKFDVPYKRLGTPIGLRETDIFMDALEEISSRKTPVKYELERGRLIDSYVDGHKYVSGKRAVIYGDPDMVVGLASFLTEIGIKPVLCATGAKSRPFHDAIEAVTEGILDEPTLVLDDIDFFDIEETAGALQPDILLGSSKGYKLAKKWNIPLVRLGFPIHDRFGAQRICHIGYKGTQDLLDTIVNVLIQTAQDQSPIGYTYI